MKKKYFVGLLLIQILTANMFAQTGTLDQSFGAGGKVVIPQISGYNLKDAYSVMIQPDDKIVIGCGALHVSTSANGMGVVRLNVDGSLDTSFSDDGLVFVPGLNNPLDIVISSNNKIILCEFGQDNVVRLNSDGTLDITFDNDGILLLPNTNLYGLDVQSDGKILLASRNENPLTSNFDFTVYRLNTDGALDAGFDEDGISYIDFYGNYDVIREIKLQNDGKIIVFGYSEDEFACARLNSNGSLDNTFGDSGKVIIHFEGNYTFGEDIGIMCDGKIVLVGTGTTDRSNYKYVVSRLMPNGDLDTSFDLDGTKITDMSGNGLAVAIQNDNHILLNGYSAGNFGIVKLNNDGSYDTGFNGNGKLILDFDGFDWGADIFLQHDDKIIVGGFSSFAIAVGRLLNNVNSDVLTCPTDIIVTIASGSDTAIVNDINPVVTTCVTTCTYQLSGATVGTGNGTASGLVFNKGETTVTYTLVDDVTESCGFKVTVKDAEDLTIICQPNVTISNTPGLCTGITTLISPTVNENQANSFGNALNFDGLDDNISIGNTNLPVGNSPRTVSGWIKTTKTSIGNIISYGNGAPGENFNVGISDGSVFVSSWSSPQYWVSASNVNNGSWHHVALSYDGANAKTYVDGILLDDRPFVINTILNSAKIGARRDGVVEFFEGSIDELSIWNIALSQEQIQANMDGVLSVQSGLIGLYHFNHGIADGINTAITSVVDDSGSNNNGILNNFSLTGSISNWVEGQFSGLSSFGNALSFNNGYIDVPHNVSINPTDQLTIETWVKTTTPGAKSLIEKYTGQANSFGYLLRISPENKAFTMVLNYDGPQLTGTTTLLPNVWYHLASTFNRATGVLKLYVNGVLDGQISGIAGLPVTPSTGSLKIGARGDDAAVYNSNGDLMDEIRIWNIERSQAQIQANMNSQLSDQPSLVNLYHFNQGVPAGDNSGLTTVLDSSGNNNNGTLINFVLNGPISNWVGGKFYSPTLINNAPDTYPIGNTTVTWTATNASGNTATCNQIVTVLDTENPTIVCSSNVTINKTPGQCTGTTALQNPTTSDNCSRSGNALSFDNGYIDIPNSTLNSSFDEWTIETWAKRANTDTQESLIEKYMPVGGTYGYLLRFVGNNAMAGFVFNSYEGYFITGTITISPNTWYHLAATFNRTTGIMKLYVNGVLDVQQTGMIGFPIVPSAGTLKLGARGDDAATRLVNGSSMDEVRIWNVERTQTQIQANMNSQLSAQQGLVGLYHFNQGVPAGDNSGLTTVLDSSGNNNNGTLINFALTGLISNWVEGNIGGEELFLTNNAPETYPIGNTTVTWLVKDASNNIATSNQIVTVIDNENTQIHWQSISTRGYHTVGLKSDGTLWAWGYNNEGQLGDGTLTNRTSPVQIGTATNWLNISAGLFHTVAVKSDGTLWAWGYNGFGNLGDGTYTNRINPIQIGTETNWLSVKAGGYYNFGLKTDGTLWAWGHNSYGKLGDGTFTNRVIPVQIGTDSNWKGISTWDFHTVGLKTDGTLWTWGFNYWGQLGDGTNINRNFPIQIGTATNWLSISAGFYHTVGLKTDGTLWAWGKNSNGELGDGTTNDKNTPSPIGLDSNWQKISAGSSLTFGLKIDGTLWAWGNNSTGKLGDGTYVNRIIPGQIGSDIDWESISTAENHTIGLKINGLQFCATGTNNFGQLGDGSGVSRNSFACTSIPYTIPGNITPSSISPIPLGTTFSLGIAYTGTVSSSAYIDWDDGTNEYITFTTNPFQKTHSYTNPGIYTVIITLTNACSLEEISFVYQYVVVYDPNGGFVTGGGWINSPAGAYKANITLTGKANFGFVAKYKKGSNIPEGSTEFQFQLGNLNFNSSSYEVGRLVIAGAKANYKGVGTINGQGNYGFLVSAIDGEITGGGGVDKFRIKIWDKNNGNAIMYDNNIVNIDEDEDPVTVISGGSIMIHEVKKNTTERVVELDRKSTDSYLFNAKIYPNPTNQHFTLVVEGSSKEKIEVMVYDILGRLMSHIKNSDNNFIRFGKELPFGYYIAVVKQGTNQETVKLIKQK